MFQLGNLGFSMTHDLASGNTLAFLHGWNIFSGQNAVTADGMVSHDERIHHLLESSIPLWRHPLLLPTLLLQEHLFRCEDFIWRTLSPRIREIERDLGVTRSGRLVHTAPAVPDAIKELLADDEKRIRITSAVNTNLVDTITVINILKWDQRLTEFIKRADKELHVYYKGAEIDISAVRELESAVDHFSCEAVSSAEYVTGMRSRLEISLNVVCLPCPLPKPREKMELNFRIEALQFCGSIRKRAQCSHRRHDKSRQCRHEDSGFCNHYIFTSFVCLFAL
jgi:hypothetical protein